MRTYPACNAACVELSPSFIVARERDIRMLCGGHTMQMNVLVRDGT